MKSEELDFLMNEKKRFNNLYKVYRDAVQTAMAGTITSNSDVTLDFGVNGKTTEKLYRAMELEVFFKKRVDELDKRIKEII